ncbi:Phage capsid and scaffold [hydrothermal vent metagenome]|uniref:Phage capsid and scaffold n=1 Tax=hydrothermal vent metagenome TaxID=652676 RepID=A0A3B1D6L4_9ZZZZ
MTISIELKNLSGVQNFQTGLPARMQTVFAQTANALLFKSTESAKERVLDDSRKPRNRSGAYLQSIHSESTKSKFQVVGQVASAHPNAAILEFGSRPHVIEAKDKNTLFWPGASSPVKKVNHPGTPAFNVLGSAVEEGLESLGGLFQQKLSEQFQDRS